MDFNFILETIMGMFTVLPRTLLITVIPFGLALILGCLFGALIFLEVPFIGKFLKLYVSFFRGTPLVGQIFVFYFGLPTFIPFLLEVSREFIFMLCLTFHLTGYVTEYIRGAMKSVDKGQLEAATTLRISKARTVLEIVMPQALPIALPSLTGCFIDAIKSSSLAFTIGIMDITAFAKVKAGYDYQYLESYLAMLLLYWVLTSLVNIFSSHMEKNQYWLKIRS